MTTVLPSDVLPFGVFKASYILDAKNKQEISDKIYQSINTRSFDDMETSLYYMLRDNETTYSEGTTYNLYHACLFFFDYIKNKNQNFIEYIGNDDDLKEFLYEYVFTEEQKSKFTWNEWMFDDPESPDWIAANLELSINVLVNGAVALITDPGTEVWIEVTDQIDEDILDDMSDESEKSLER